MCWESDSLLIYQTSRSSVGLEHHFDIVGVRGPNPLVKTILENLIFTLYIWTGNSYNWLCSLNDACASDKDGSLINGFEIFGERWTTPLAYQKQKWSFPLTHGSHFNGVLGQWSTPLDCRSSISRVRISYTPPIWFSAKTLDEKSPTESWRVKLRKVSYHMSRFLVCSSALLGKPGSPGATGDLRDCITGVATLLDDSHGIR